MEFRSDTRINWNAYHSCPKKRERKHAFTGALWPKTDLKLRSQVYMITAQTFLKAHCAFRALIT